MSDEDALPSTAAGPPDAAMRSPATSGSTETPGEADGALAPLRGRRRGLRTGYTTGACATAATKAALLVLTTRAAPDRVTIRLPVGEDATFTPHRCERLSDHQALASVIKDAGDDPDVTHGAEIRAKVTLGEATPGLRIDGGEGIGRVTKPGLGLEVGTAAINPIPRQMITEVVREALGQRLAREGVSVVISVPDGEERAKKTLNARLGILGGLSILGTTGIVKPYSTASYKASISKAVDVAIACGARDTIVLTTGSRSEKFAHRYVTVPEEAYVQMGEFTGYALRDCAAKSIRRVVLVGMIGKLSKIGDGRMQTHVAGAEVDVQRLAQLAATCGAPEAAVAEIAQANTARHAQEILQAAGVQGVFDAVCERARQASLAYVKRALDVAVLLVDFDGSLLGTAGSIHGDS